MGIEYLITHNGQRLEVNVRGVLAMKEVGSYFDSLDEDQSIVRGAIEVVRFRSVSDCEISFSDCENIVQAYRKPKYNNGIKATIFVCGTDLVYGTARMLQAAYEMALPEHKIFIIRSDDELEALIDSLSAGGTSS